MEERLPKPLWSAIQFAVSMIRKGQPPGQAIHRASNYYGVPEHEVAQHVGRRGGRAAGARKRRGHANTAPETTSNGNTNTGEGTNG